MSDRVPQHWPHAVTAWPNCVPKGGTRATTEWHTRVTNHDSLSGIAVTQEMALCHTFIGMRAVAQRHRNGPVPHFHRHEGGGACRRWPTSNGDLHFVCKGQTLPLVCAKIYTLAPGVQGPEFPPFKSVTKNTFCPSKTPFNRQDPTPEPAIAHRFGHA